MGRFTSVDPEDGKTKTPLSLHRYLYANESPMSFNDPTGKFTMLSVMAAVGISNILSAHAIPTVQGGKVKAFYIEMAEAEVVVEYLDGNKENYIAATGNPEIEGATTPAKGHVVSTAWGPVGTYYPTSWQEDEDSPYGPAMIILAGTNGRHIHGTNGPMNGGEEYLTVAGLGRRVTHGCARISNQSIVKLKKEVDKSLRIGRRITAEFR